MNKVNFKVVIIVFSIPILGYIGLQLLYLRSMNQVAYENYQQIYINKSLNGVVAYITEYQDNPYEIVISIWNEGDEDRISYGVTCVDKEFREHVSEGDSVFKKPGIKYITFCNKQNICKDFEINFCGKFD